MTDPRIAGLRRKYAATTEPAKRGELRNLLLAAGVDPDAKPVKPAPVTRVVPTKVTTEATTPVVTADAPKAEAAPVRRRPGRPRSKPAEDA